MVRALQRDGHPTPLGEAVASWGRIFKSFHVLALLDDESYRPDIKGIRNLQEGRHGLAGKIFHGRKGHIHERYHAGIEDQLGAPSSSSTRWTPTGMTSCSPSSSLASVAPSGPSSPRPWQRCRPGTRWCSGSQTGGDARPRTC